MGPFGILGNREYCGWVVVCCKVLTRNADDCVYVTVCMFHVDVGDWEVS